MSFGQGFGRINTDKVEFATVEQLPLDIVAAGQTNGGGQGQREIDIKPGLLVFRTDRLNF